VFRANRPVRNASPAISNRRTPNPRKFQILLLRFVPGLYKFSVAMSASVVSIQQYGTRKKQGPNFFEVATGSQCPRRAMWVVGLNLGILSRPVRCSQLAAWFLME
jgi:hypothetical protein